MQRRYSLVFLLIITSGLVLHKLGNDVIWYDEHFTLRIVGAAHYGPTAIQTLIANAINDPWQPPLYYILVWGWGRLVGWDEVALRALSWLIGLLSIALVYRLGRDLRSHTAGFAAAVTIGFSAFALTYFHELRPYAVLLTATALTFVAYIRRSQWGLFFGIGGLLYAHYFGILTAAALGVVHLLRFQPERRWWRLTGSMAAGVGIFLPWAWVPLMALGTSINEGGRITTLYTTPQLTYWTAYAFGNGLILFTGMVLGVSLWRIHTDPAARWLLLIVSINAVLLVILNAAVPVISHVRYMLALWIPLAGLAGLALDSLWRYVGWVGGITVLVVWGLLGSYQTLSPNFEARLFREVHTTFFRPALRWDTAANMLHQQVRHGDAVVISPAAHPWAVSGAVDYYLHGIPAPYAVLDDLSSNTRQSHIAGTRRVWVLTETTSTPPQVRTTFKDYLNQQYVRCDPEYDDGSLIVTRYAPSAACCTPPQKPVTTYTGGVQLAVIDALALDANTLHTRLGWAVPPDFPTHDYSISVQVMDAQNNLIGQTDYTLPPSGYICHTADVSLNGTAASAAVIVYNWATGERLTADTSISIPID